MAELDQEALQKELKNKCICRFCLSQDAASLTNIFQRDTRIKSLAPLPIQVMAIASIEIFGNDGMPPFVCTTCISMFEYSYQFKQMCKKADTLLRQYPFVGEWPESLEKPTLPRILLTASTLKQKSANHVQQSNKNVKQEPLLLQKKILKVDADDDENNTNDNVANSKHCDIKVEKLDNESTIIYLEKIYSNNELSIDDIQLLMDSEDVPEAEPDKMESRQVVDKPKLLNKCSVRILNKAASREKEPRLSLPKIKKSDDGNVEIVAEILNIDDKYEEEPDPKNAEAIETNVFPCPYCQRSFPLMQLRDIHIKNHLRHRKFQCKECDKAFFSKYDLQKHSYVHMGYRPYKCSACDKAFSRLTLLTKHKKTHTGVTNFICVHCESCFLSKEDLEKHAETHNKNRRFQCKLCSKSFVFKQGLERHEVIHSRQQPFTCQYCEQSFSTTTKLYRHLTAHAGVRPYPCRFCKKSYLLPHHLTRHMRSHKNINDNINALDFTCSTCKTRFGSRDELIQHSKTHANEQNLACSLCKETFDNINNLTTHIQDHAEGEAYACEFCDLLFITAKKLQLHTDLDHDQEMEEYQADDRALANKKEENSTTEKNDVSDESLQNAVNAFLMDEFQTEQTENDNQVDDENSILTPLKQRKIIVTGTQIVASEVKTVQQQNKQPPQIKRKVANATRSKNHPTLHSLLKISGAKSAAISPE